MNNRSIFFIFSLAIFIAFFSCGPAAEDRQAMHARAKVFQDSIANAIRASLNEAESPAPMPIAQPGPATNTPTPAK